MKKLLVLTFISFIVLSSVYGVTKGVTRLTYENHALKTDINNDMVIIKFQDPGMPGANQTWNFSNIQQIKDFNGLIQKPRYLKSAFFSNQFNTELIEFGNSFFFNITDKKIEMTGYRSANGGMEIAYDKPFLKMVYPFEFGNSFNGSFSGQIKSGNIIGDIEGTYNVEADGFGKLILPNNVTIENTLRVKTVKNYKQAFSSSASNVTITTYRWYTQNVRYPVLVLITTENEINGRTNTSHTAAYKNNLDLTNINEQFQANEIKTYPNPFSNKFNVAYELAENSDVKIEVYDVTGKKIALLMDQNELSGIYVKDFSVDDLGLKQGMYNIGITINGHTEYQRLLHIK